jgi:hypothetical protein
MVDIITIFYQTFNNINVTSLVALTQIMMKAPLYFMTLMVMMMMMMMINATLQ